jgi:hypothetical protein
MSFNTYPPPVNSGAQVYTIGVTVDGSGSVVTVGTKGVKSIPVSGDIVAVRLLADLAGDIEFDLKVDDPASTYPPTTSIVAAAPPTLTGADYMEDTSLMGWTLPVTAGDVMEFEITGVPDIITRVTLEVFIQPS